MISLGLAAGNDPLMICHRTEQAFKVLEKSPSNQFDRAYANLTAFKAKMAPPTTFTLENFQSLDQGVWDLRVNVLGAEGAATRSPEDEKRSPVETY